MQGRMTAAAKLLALANQEYSMAPVHESLARLHQFQGDWGKAIEEWQRVLDLRGEILQDHSPADWVLAHFAIARAYSKTNDSVSAEKYYREFLEIWSKSDSLTIKKEASDELQLLKSSRERGT